MMQWHDLERIVALLPWCSSVWYHGRALWSHAALQRGFRPKFMIG